MQCPNVLKNSKILLMSVLFFYLTTATAQTGSLFDDTYVSTVLIQISPSNLEDVYNTAGTDQYFPARFIFDDGNGRDTVEDIGFRLRGNTSLYSEKKSFKVSFNTYEPGRRYQEVKKINLNGNHNDPTMIREKLYYDIWNRFGLPERRVSFVRLYINDEYMGLYTNLEEMDKDWLARSYDDNDGNLYKCTYPAPLSYLGTNPQVYKDVESSTASGGRAYDLQTNELEDDYSDLAELITGLHQPAVAAFPANISQMLDVNTYLKALAVEVICGHWDNYAYNQNNYFLYHDPTDGLFDFISYDADNTMGVDWFGIDWTTQDPYHWINSGSDRPLYQKMMAFPAFRNQYSLYLDTLARFIVLPDSIFPRIDVLHDLITPAAIDDEYRTYDYGYTIDDFHNGFDSDIGGHTPYGIKPFFENRIANLDLIIGTVTANESLFEWEIYPNPSSDYLFLKNTLPTGDQATFAIYDITGNMISSSTLERSGSVARIDISHLANGFYSISLITKNRREVYGFVKQG